VSEQPVAGGDSIAERLADKVAQPEFKKLVILVARSEVLNQFDLYQTWRRRRAFVGLLKSAGLTKVHICHYRVPHGAVVNSVTPTYLHSKTWIFDDDFCIVSSANCNRRGYTHDSEIGAGIFDPNPDGDRLNFAHELRIRLWMRHLNPTGDSSLTRRDLLDPVTASRFWRRPPANALIEDYDEFGDNRTPPATSNPSPDRRLPIPYQSVTGLLLQSFDDDWNTVIDPDGS
jgi:phosphatidylserine/phosphatidylglycerophosphate/cardiolipin synthase-like enzyme